MLNEYLLIWAVSSRSVCQSLTNTLTQRHHKLFISFCVLYYIF